MKRPLVVISVLNWNAYDETAKCIESLFHLDYPRLRILVVDNGSADGSAQHLQKYADKVDLILSPTNLGFTGGHNLAIARALKDGADYVWLLNNDVTVAPDSLSKLVEAAEQDPKIGLASPVLFYANPRDKVWNCGAALDRESCHIKPLEDLDSASRFQASATNSIVLYGTALLIRREMIDTIGVLDDNLFAYCEDLDYSIRSLDAGFRNITVFDSHVYHNKSPDLGTEVPKAYFYYLRTRNDYLVKRKHVALFRGVKAKMWHTRHILNWMEESPGNTVKQEGCLAGLWDVWSGVKGPYNPSRRMPWPFRLPLQSNPGFWRRVLDRV